MRTLVIATRNRHKTGEIKAILGPDWLCQDLMDFPAAPQVEEDAGTFSGNATKKAIVLAKWLASLALPPRPGAETQRLVLADDSGLEVDALNGAPGVHSARFAALDAKLQGNSPSADNNAKLLRLLQNVPREQRTARFRCAIAVVPVLPEIRGNASPTCSADEYELQAQLFEGSCEGHIEVAPRGEGGFGYDPLFVPAGFTKTFAELPERTKNQISHRARALEQLRRSLTNG